MGAADSVPIDLSRQPIVRVAANALIAADDGILMDEYLETDTPGVFAAGDVARWPVVRTRPQRGTPGAHERPPRRGARARRRPARARRLMCASSSAS
jgi:NADPH-dependent 2,4-dienoyl-CoA reductase/sulfur reductase-like enzyme